MNRQEIFDAAIAHARQQHQKSEQPRENQTPLCMYRGPKGLKCFFGALIEDKEYHKEWEKMDIMMVLNDRRCPQTLTSRLDPEHNGENFLSALQNLHDNWEVAEWESRFERLTRDYDLKYTSP